MNNLKDAHESPLAFSCLRFFCWILSIFSLLTLKLSSAANDFKSDFVVLGGKRNRKITQRKSTAIFLSWAVIFFVIILALRRQWQRRRSAAKTTVISYFHGCLIKFHVEIYVFFRLWASLPKPRIEKKNKPLSQCVCVCALIIKNVKKGIRNSCYCWWKWS